MRRNKALLAGAGFLCAGLLYGYVLIPLGFRMPCLFRRVTGLRCPGCGITDLCLGLLLTVAAPWILGLLWLQRRYPKAAGALAWVLVAFLLAWGVLRNLWGI